MKFFNYKQLYFKIYEFYRLHILHQHDCDNCKYFGGLMCNHVDENNKCLGWEKVKYHPIQNFKRKRLMKKVLDKSKKI